MFNNKTVYVYDQETGRVLYTVDDLSESQLSQFNVNESHYIGPSGLKISGNYVKREPMSGKPLGISPIEHMTFVDISKHEIVSDGVDEAVISNIRMGTHVNINNEHSYVVDDETGTSLELSCNNYSYIPEHNQMTVYLKAYGCHDSKITINVIEA